MKHVLIYVIVFNFCFFSLRAQITKTDYYNKIDNKIYTFSKEKPTASFDTITSFVNANFQSQEDRARAYYTWIVLNVKFDEDYRGASSYFLIKDLRNLENLIFRANQACKNRLAASEGMAALMQMFCKSSNIPCYTVAGYFRRPDKSVSDMSFVWNVLYLDSTWVQIDVSTVNGYLNDEYKYIHYPMKNYFCIAPSEFINDHLSHDPMWQLLLHPCEIKDFIMGKYSTGSSVEYNFNDSLISYQNKTTEQQLETDITRYFKYEINPTLRSRNLDHFNYDKVSDVMDIANQYFDKYLEIGKNKLSKYPLKSDWEKAKNLIDKAAFYFREVEIMSEKLPYTSIEGEDTYKALRFNLQNNLETLKKNKEYLEKLKPFLKDK